MAEFRTIKEFYEFVKADNIDEAGLKIVLDSDGTSFYINDKEIIVSKNGYYGVKDLYSLLFPGASVIWC